MPASVPNLALVGGPISSNCGVPSPLISDRAVAVQVGPRRVVGLLKDRVELRGARQGVARDEPARERFDRRLAVAEYVPGKARPRRPVVPVRGVLDLRRSRPPA